MTTIEPGFAIVEMKAGEPGETFTTIELKINFLVRSGAVCYGPKAESSNPAAPSASSNATSRTRRGGVVHATSTCMTLRGAAAGGR